MFFNEMSSSRLTSPNGLLTEVIFCTPLIVTNQGVLYFLLEMSSMNISPSISQ